MTNKKKKKFQIMTAHSIMFHLCLNPLLNLRKQNKSIELLSFQLDMLKNKNKNKNFTHLYLTSYIYQSYLGKNYKLQLYVQ